MKKSNYFKFAKSMKPSNFELLKYSMVKNKQKSEFKRRAFSATRLNKNETKVVIPEYQDEIH